MNFENKLNQMLSTQGQCPDKTGFLDRLHHTREKQLIKKQRTLSGFSAISLVLLTGFLAFSQLDIGSEIFVDESSRIETENYIDDLALLLLDYDEDVWTVYELLDEINHESVTEI